LRTILTQEIQFNVHGDYYNTGKSETQAFFLTVCACLFSSLEKHLTHVVLNLHTVHLHMGEMVTEKL